MKEALVKFLTALGYGNLEHIEDRTLLAIISDEDSLDGAKDLVSKMLKYNAILERVKLLGEDALREIRDVGRDVPPVLVDMLRIEHVRCSDLEEDIIRYASNVIQGIAATVEKETS